MKALSLTQPWATLIAIGAKRIETWSWLTNYRGLMAIHASKAMPPAARAFVVAIAEPIPCKGALGLWMVPAEIAADLREQVNQKGPKR